MNSYGVAIACMLATLFLPYVAIIIAKAGPGFDNRYPRDWLARMEGYRKRAHAAHLNAFETTPPFYAAVILNIALGSAAVQLNQLALLFVVMRVLHLVFYVGDKPTLRSIVFTVGMGCVVALFWHAFSIGLLIVK